MIGAHQAVFDGHLARDEIDQPPVDKVRRHAAGTAFVQQDAFLLDPRQTADARTDRNAGAQLELVVHVDETRILERLARRVDAIDDERIDLALNLVIDALVGIEAEFMILGLHLAGDGAFLPLGVEARDLRGSALARDQVLP